MPAKQPDVTSDQTAQLPDWLNGYVVLVQYLTQQGLWDDIWKHLKINRQGYQGIDLVMVLLAYWSSHRKEGLKEFLAATQPWGDQLAAVAGRKSWPTQSSMSRALHQVELKEVEPFNQWIFARLADTGRGLLKHSAAYHYDCEQEKLRLFHGDGTVHALRHRALPEGEAWPAPRRLVGRLAKPGYAGRKRGEVVYTTTAVQEAGSGLWTGLSFSAGSGQLSHEIEQLTESAEHWVTLLGDTPKRALLITDGEGGGRGQAACGARSEIGFGTRLGCYSVLDDPAVRVHLNESAWTQVPDSMSGPTRWAAELGTIQIWGAIVRAVLTRFESDKNSKRGAGRVIDGWQYELFGFDVESYAGLPAPEAVAVYYGRNGIENSFAMKNREFSAPRTLSYAPGGQYLAVALSFITWNLEILVGAALEGELVEVVCEPKKRHTEPADLPAMPTCAPASTDDTKYIQIDDALIERILSECDWPTRLDEGWTYDAASRHITCPTGDILTLQAARLANKRVELCFRGSYVGCTQCPLRKSCSRSKVKRFRREVIIGHRIDFSEFETTATRYDWKPPPERSTPATTQWEGSRFVPGEFRRTLRRSTQVLAIAILLGEETVEPSLPLYVVQNATDRQRRRQTWGQRNDWNATVRSIIIQPRAPAAALAPYLTKLLETDAPGAASPISANTG